MDSDALRPLQSLVYHHCSLRSQGTILLACKAARAEDLAAMLPTPEDIQRSARKRVEKSFHGACRANDTWMALLVRHLSAGAIAAQFTVDELDGTLLITLIKHAKNVVENGTCAEFVMNTEQFVACLTQIVEKWRIAVGTNDLQTSVRCLQSLGAVASLHGCNNATCMSTTAALIKTGVISITKKFMPAILAITKYSKETCFSTTAALIEAGAIWPMVYTLQTYQIPVAPALNMRVAYFKSYCLVTKALAQMLADAGSLRTIRKDVLSYAVHLLVVEVVNGGELLASYSKRLASQLQVIVFKALAEMAGHQELAADAVRDGAMQLLTWWHLLNDDHWAHKLAGKFIIFFAMQMLAHLTDPHKHDVHPRTTALLVAYFTKFQEHLFQHDYYDSERAYYHSSQPYAIQVEWVTHALRNISCSHGSLNWIVDAKAVVSFLMRALSDETLESVHAAHTLSNMALVRQHRDIILEAGVSKALSRFLGYMAFLYEDADEDDMNNFGNEEIAIFLREYERVRQHISHVVERMQ